MEAVVDGKDQRDHSAVASVQHAVAILECFRFDRPEQTVSGLSAQLGMPSSTVHRLLRSLTDTGLVERTSRGHYRLGLRLFELGQAAVLSRPIREQAHRHLEVLRERTGHTVQLAVLDGMDVVYLDRLEDAASFRRLGMAGLRSPVHASSSGKVLLAFGAPESLLRQVERRGLGRRATRTMTSSSMFRTSLALTRKQGFAESMEENWPELTSIAAPVIGRDGNAVAALSVVGPVASFGPEQRAKAARVAIAEARLLASELVDRLDRTS
jgi:IclR family transcriptional regulator, acetate operon repressor